MGVMSLLLGSAAPRVFGSFFLMTHGWLILDLSFLQPRPFVFRRNFLVYFDSFRSVVGVRFHYLQIALSLGRELVGMLDLKKWRLLMLAAFYEILRCFQVRFKGENKVKGRIFRLVRLEQICQQKESSYRQRKLKVKGNGSLNS